MVDTSVKIAGLDFKNPIGIASHAPKAPWGQWPPEKDAPEIQMKLWRKYYEADVGFLVTGTMLSKNLSNAASGGRTWASKDRRNQIGWISGATIPDAFCSHDNGLEAMRRAKKEFTDMRIIASIIGAVDLTEWVGLALECEQCDADMLELNLGSTMFMETIAKTRESLKMKDGIPPGTTIGQVPEIVASIVREIRNKTNLPIIVKQTGEVTFFGLYNAVPLYIEAGASAMTLNHAFMTIAPPDIYGQGKTTFPHMDKTTWWSSIGPVNRFLCYRNVSMVAKYYPRMEIMACGGLVTPEQCIEIMMLGANGVQLSSGIVLNGVSFASGVVTFLKKYMQEQGYQSVKDFLSLGQNYIAEMNEIQEILKSQIGKLVAFIDYDKCVGVESCKVCTDSICTATYVENGFPKVYPEMCSSCNYCVIRCPHDARYLSEK